MKENIQEALAVVGLSAGIVMMAYNIVDKICTIVCKTCTVCK